MEERYHGSQKSKQDVFRISNKSSSRRDLNKIKNIREKSARNHRNDIRNSFNDKSESNYWLSRNIYLYKHRQPTGSKDMNMLDHVVTNNIKTNKYQLNNTI